ncbi:phage major capsid protein [Streptomyces sp. NPDC002666]
MEFPALIEAQGKLDHARKELASVMAESKDSTGAYNLDNIKSVSGDKAAKLAWIQAKQAELVPLKQAVEGAKSLKQAAEAAMEYDAEQAEFKGGDQGRETKGGRELSIAEHFTKSEAFKTKGAKSHLDVDVKTLFQTGRVSGAGWTPEVTRSGLVTLKPMVSAPSVADHLVTVPVSQVGYKYMEETTYTNGAAMTQEGGTFGEAALALTERNQPVEKMTVWIPVTDEQLEDEPGAEAYVHARLQNMLRQKIDVQVLQGDGSTPNLLGTVNKVGIQTRALGSDTLLDASYKLFTTIRTDGFAEPSVCFLNAAAWQPVMLLKTADGQYIYSNPASGAPSVLWGVPVVQTQAAVAGTMVTGDYSGYAFLGVKRGIDVQVTNSHDTNFINGKQAIRMDTRMVMVHIRPKAFGTLTGLDS